MNRILYFNIDYRCNNKCVFCFSHNVGTNRGDISLDRFIEILKNAKADNGDLIVINGGEPFLHENINQMMYYVLENGLRCNIYTNGTLLNGLELNLRSNNITFVIPVHGYEKTHDVLTARAGAYTQTLESLFFLEHHSFRYSLKFILSKELISSGFDISNFIATNQLHPVKLYIARMNSTIRSMENNYSLPQDEQLIHYIEAQQSKLDLAVGYLDFPPCYLRGIDIQVDIDKLDEWDFYFNDCTITMQKRDYAKERLNNAACKCCNYNSLCNHLSSTYYILGQKNGIITYEIE